MQTIVGEIIVLTKGDTFKATVSMIQSNGELYTPAEGDVVRFHMKKNYSDPDLLIEKIIPNDTLLLKLDPVDTSSLNVGNYVYDIQITYANGDVDTFIDQGTLTLTEEVEGTPPTYPKFAKGSFTTIEDSGGEGTVQINYTGNGYPVSLVVYIENGITGSFFNNAPRYAVGMFSMVKASTTDEPTYTTTSSTKNGGSVMVLWKNSDSIGATYDSAFNVAYNTFTSADQITDSGVACIRFKGNGTTLSYRTYAVSSQTHTTGLLPDRKYEYVIEYSE